MKLGNKGFAVTSIIYSMLVLFLALVLLIMSNLASRKVLFDKEKNEILDKLTSNIEQSAIKVCRFKEGNAYAVGSKYICNPGDGDKVFYVLENLEDSENITLIMERNIDNDTMPWCLEGTDLSCGGDGAKTALTNKTTNWTNPQIISIGLPTSEQVYNLNLNGDLSAYPWMYGYLYDIPSKANGYWIDVDAESADAQTVIYTGRVERQQADSSDDFGVRPTITISKSSL